MNAKEFEAALAVELGVSKVRAGEILKGFKNAGIQSLAKEGRFVVGGFGCWEVTTRTARRCRNPNTV